MQQFIDMEKRCLGGRKRIFSDSWRRWLQPVRMGFALLAACTVLALSGCGGSSNSSASIKATPVSSSAATNRLNDTGITTWGNATANNLTVTQSLFPNQDADVGRDANPALNSNADGRAGFSFTKLDAAGQPLANQAAVYAVTPWSCVQDKVTGMMWEVKTGGGGLRDASYTYTWYNSTGVNDGGNAGTPNGGLCIDGINCDTEKYVAAVNAAGLCGFSDWRLPKKEALRSIVDYSIASFRLTVDTGYFPNTVGNWYWSSGPYAASATPGAWGVYFVNGFANVNVKSISSYVRLVRGGQ